MRKRFAFFFVLCLLASLSLCFSAAAAEEDEDLPRAKSIGITKDEWMARYNAVPESLATQKTDVYPINIGVTDDRKNYFAMPVAGVSFVLMCEDTTDQLVSASITYVPTALGSYEQGVAAGKFTTEFAVRAAYASQPDISPDDVSRVCAILDADALKDGSDFKRTCEVGGLRYVFSSTDQSVFFGFCSTETFASEEEFQQYRASSSSQDAPSSAEEVSDELTEALAQGVQLSPGLYLVGEDFPAGRYQVIVADDVFYEAIGITRNDLHNSYDYYSIGTRYDGTTATISLNEGDQVEITDYPFTLRTFKGILN